ncbi:MAG: integrase family protein [Colwellia sp.]
MGYKVVKFSNTLINKTAFSEEVVLLKDTDVPGLICRIGKRSKTYSLRYSVKGVTKTKKLGCALLHSVADIRKKALKHLLRVEDGFGADFETINDIINGPYLTDARINKKNIKPELSKLEKHIRPYFGHLEFNQITQPLINQFIEEKLDTLSHSTVDRLSAIARKVGRFAVDSGAHPVNVFRNWKQFNRDNARTQTMRPEQLKPFISCCLQDNNKVHQDVLMLCATAGGRIGELKRIKVTDVNIENGTIVLPLTKSGKPQTLILNSFALEIVKRRIAETTNEWLFPSNRNIGSPIHYPRGCWERIQARMLELGHDISNLRNHDLRRVFGSVAAKNSDVLTTSKLLHHGSVGVTMRYIAHQDDDLRETSEAVANAYR